MANKENIIIRKARDEDLIKVYKMGLARELSNPDGKPPRKWWIDGFLYEKQFFHVVEKGKRIIGFALAERTTGNIMLIQEIFVKSEYRGGGIGDLLIKKLEADAKKRKMRAILLYAYAENRKTLHFYKKEKYGAGSFEEEFVKFLK